MKKGTMILILILVCMVISSVSAYAGNKSYNCYVLKAGCYGDLQVRAWLTDEDGKFKNKVFISKSGRSKEMLAILLTAINANMMVRIKTDLEEEGNPYIKDLYIIAP